MTTSKVIVTAHVLTYQLWSQIYPGEFDPVYWLYRLQLQTHLVLDPLSTTETCHLPQMYMIHLQRSYCYFHQPLYHLCHCLLTLNADMLGFEMPDFLGENVHRQKGNVSLDKDDYCPHTDHRMTVGLSCIEYVCYTVHYIENLKQRVFLKNWLMADITFWAAYRCTSFAKRLESKGHQTAITLISEKNHVQVYV